MAEGCKAASRSTARARNRRPVKLAGTAMALMVLTACAHGSPGSLEYDAIGPQNKSESSKAAGVTTGAGVNSFLWRASLDTISFIPLASADPYGGVIITDWYSNPEKPNERFKVTVYILDQQLRSDALRASVFRQVKGAGGAWVDAATEPATGPKLENAILTRAREMRIAATNK